MKIGILCLPRFRHLKALIVRQLAGLPHSFCVYEQRGRDHIDGGMAGLPLAANVEIVLLDDVDFASIRAHVERVRIDNVVSFSDRGVVLAAEVRTHFGMGGNTPAIEARVVHKGSTRQRLREAGLSRVDSRVTTLDRLGEDIGDLPLPAIVKPTSLGASMCVEKIDDLAQLPDYVARCRANRIFRERDELLIEKYVPGPELSVEGLVARGKVHFLGVTESHTSGPPYFVGTGHDFFAEHHDAPRLYAFVTDVIRCLEIDDCPFHIELKYEGGGLEVLEAHTRYGGAMIMELVEEATGVQPFAHYIETLAGAPFHRPSSSPDIRAQHLLCTPDGVIDRIRLDAEVTTHPQVISWALDVADGGAIEPNVVPIEYAGYVNFRASDRADARRFRSFIDEHFSIRHHPRNRSVQVHHGS